MKILLSFAVLGMMTLGTAAVAKPGGCLKYGAGGAAAGHMVHHGVRGFLAGCAVGMYRRHEYNKQMRLGGQ